MDGKRRQTKEDKNIPTVAPGLEGELEYVPDATKRDRKKGESTRVIRLTNDQPPS